jgi:hypothetical protein
MLKLWGRPTSGRTQKVLWTLAEIGMRKAIGDRPLFPSGKIGNDRMFAAF